MVTIPEAKDFSDTVEELVSQVTEPKEALYWLVLERNFYYSKLCETDTVLGTPTGSREREHCRENFGGSLVHRACGSWPASYYCTHWVPAGCATQNEVGEGDQLCIYIQVCFSIWRFIADLEWLRSSEC